jgi:TonB family protein
MQPAHALVMALSVAALWNSPFGQAARSATSPQQPPAGRRITARDGDVVVVDNDARVRVVRRRDANVHAIFNAAQAWLVVIVDYIDPTSKSADNRVDFSYSFDRVSDNWPLGERWEGTATIEDYFSVPGDGPMVTGLGLATPSGLVQLLGGPNGSDLFRDQSAVAVLSYQGAGRGGGGGRSFAEAEQSQVANALRNVETRGNLSGPNARFQTSVSMGVSGGVSGGVAGGIVGSSSVTTGSVTQGGPVRVGGTIAAPRKLVDTPPVYPETARAAGIGGLVILEVTIGTDGSVANARVLRSIPLLDGAALDAARQWRYEPTYLNGAAVPVILTATVRFP